MYHLELDLKKIASLAEQNESENFEFRAFLKGQDPEKVDKVVHELHEHIVSQIDCQKCGNCCHELCPGLSASELKTLAEIDKLSESEFEDKYVAIDEFEGIKYMKDTPCKYLNGNSCAIYEKRPEVCRSYPHTHKAQFTSRTFGMIENYGICPIVFNLMEELKERMGFFRRGGWY